MHPLVRLMLLVGQELLEHVHPLIKKLRIKRLSNLIQGLSRLPLMLVDQYGILGTIKAEEFLLVLILELVQVDVWLGPSRNEIKHATSPFLTIEIGASRELDRILFQAVILALGTSIVFHLNARMVLLN